MLLPTLLIGHRRSGHQQQLLSRLLPSGDHRRALLAIVFRGKFLDGLERSHKNHKLTLAGQLTVLQSPTEFRALPCTAAHRNWVVYAKRPFAGPA